MSDVNRVFYLYVNICFTVSDVVTFVTLKLRMGTFIINTQTRKNNFIRYINVPV